MYTNTKQENSVMNKNKNKQILGMIIYWKNLEIEELIPENDPDYIRKYHEEAIKRTNDVRDYLYIAESIIETFDDKKWAEEIYNKAIKENRFDEYIGPSIIKYLGNEEWGLEICKDAMKKAKWARSYCHLADNIFPITKDEEYIKKVYHKALKAATDFNDYQLIAASIIKNLKDKKWARETYKQAIDAIESIESIENDENLASYEKLDKFYSIENNYIIAAKAVIVNWNDKKWGKELYICACNSLAMLKGEYRKYIVVTYLDIAEKVVENLDDQEFALEIYQKTMDEINTYDDYLDLRKSIKKHIKNRDSADKVLRSNKKFAYKDLLNSFLWSFALPIVLFIGYLIVMFFIGRQTGLLEPIIVFIGIFIAYIFFICLIT